MVCFKPKILIWVNFGEGLERLENVGVFNGHLGYFTDIWDILWPFLHFVFILVHFACFGIKRQEKSGNPDWRRDLKKRFDFSDLKVTRRPGSHPSLLLLNQSPDTTKF
jgi:hypothetical protein